MNEYLGRHPEIHMLPKELHYWGSDLQYMYPRITKNDYQQHLQEAPAGQLIGEGAVWYLYSEKAASELKAYTPNAKIIIMLRHPVAAIHALHSQMVYTGNEPEETLSNALELEVARKNGKHIPEHYYCPLQGLWYQSVYQYTPQVQRYLEVFGREQVHFIFHHQMKANMAEVYRNALTFLGVNPEFTTEFNTINPNQSTKNKTLRNFTLTPSKTAKSIVKAVIPSKKMREKIKGKVWDINTKAEERTPMDEALQQQLEAACTNDIQQLEALLDMDLGWTTSA